MRAISPTRPIGTATLHIGTILLDHAWPAGIVPRDPATRRDRTPRHAGRDVDGEGGFGRGGGGISRDHKDAGHHLLGDLHELEIQLVFRDWGWTDGSLSGIGDA